MLFSKNYLAEAKRQAIIDVDANTYQPDRCIAQLGIPEPDEDDRLGIELRKARVEDSQLVATATFQQKSSERVKQPPRTTRVLGLIVLLLGEWGALIVLFQKELGFTIAEALFFSTLLTPSSFFLTHLVRKHAFGDDRRWWAFLILGGYALFGVTLTFLRTVAHGTPDTSLAYNLGVGVILCLATLLPGWLGDSLYDDVRATTPIVRELAQLSLTVDHHKQELEITNEQRRAIKEYERLLKQLRATYDAAHDAACAAKGIAPMSNAQLHLPPKPLNAQPEPQE